MAKTGDAAKMCDAFEMIIERLSAIERKIDDMKTVGQAVAGPHGSWFATRLDAKWAYVFEEFGWRWQYRPPLMSGYAATFLVSFSAETLWVDVAADGGTETRYTQLKLGGWKGAWMRVGDTVRPGDCEEWMIIGQGGDPETLDGCIGERWIDSLVVRLHVSEGKESWVIGGNRGLYELNICDGDTGWKHNTHDSGDRFEEIWARSGTAATNAPLYTWGCVSWPREQPQSAQVASALAVIADAAHAYECNGRGWGV